MIDVEKPIPNVEELFKELNQIADLDDQGLLKPCNPDEGLIQYTFEEFMEKLEKEKSNGKV